MTTPNPDPPGPGLPPAEYAWKVHGYTNEYIRFGDAKAGAVLTWCAGLIAVLFAAKVHHHFTQTGFSRDWEWGQTLLSVGAASAFGLLSAAVACAFMAIKPRLWSTDKGGDHPKGLIFWETVRAHANPEAYARALLAALPEEQTKSVCEHVFVLGGIVSRKYYWIDWSIIFGAPGSIVAGVVALFTP